MFQPTSRLDADVFKNRCSPESKLRLLTGWFRQWMIYHFSDPENIHDQRKKNVWVWRPHPSKRGEADPHTTGIVIESITKYDVSFTETRPAVLIKRHKWQMHRIGVNHQLLGLTGPSGETYHVNHWLGSHTLFCIAGEPAEAEALAIEVYTEINEFSPIVRKVLNLIRFEPSAVDEVGILEEAKPNFVVPVTVQYAVEETWLLQEDAPFLRKWDIALEQI